MPNLAAILNRRSPARLGELAQLGFDPSVSPSLASLLASASAVQAPNGAAPTLGGLPTAPEAEAPGYYPPAKVGGLQTLRGDPHPKSQPQSLGDLMPVNFGVDPIRTTGPSLGDFVARELPRTPDLHKGPNWGKIAAAVLGIAGDAIVGAHGGQPVFGPMMARRRLAKQEHEYDLEKFNRELELKRQDALRPRPEQVGNTIGMFDPGGLSFNPIFTAPSPPEQYASALGHKPGTPEFAQAVQDYRLGTYSDPAMQNRLTLEDVRYQNRDALQDQRLGVTRRGQDLTHRDRQDTIRQSDTNNRRSTSTSRENNIRSTDTSRENNTANNRTRFQTSRKPPRGAPVKVSTPEEARKLDPGTFFETPDGRILQR